MKTATFVTLLGLAFAPLGLAQSETLGPAPTESFGCEPHGDHYHCEGHVSETSGLDGTGVSTPTPTPHDDDHDHDDHDHDHEEEEEDHDHESGTGSLPPSPTASVGCEPHGDHWHCDGPAETGESNEEAAATTDSEDPEETGGVVAQIIPLAGALAAAVMAF